MNLAEIPDEKIIIPGLLILAGISYFCPGDHPIVVNVISGLLGYMTKMGVDMVKQLALPTPTSAVSTKTETSTETVSESDLPK